VGGLHDALKTAMLDARTRSIAPRFAACVLAGFVFALAPARADRVLTKDGRVLSPKKARVQGEGYRFVFENGEILVATKDFVQSVEIEGDMSEYVPQNEDEKQKLAQGYVKYKGKWFSKPGYEDELRKEHAKSKARTDLLALHSDWRNAWSKETQHFKVFSDTTPELLDYYCDLLEAYYKLMDDRFGIEPTLEMRRTKMTVNVYKSYEEFQQLSDPRAGIKPGVLGYFWKFNNTLNFYHDYQEPARSNWVALHECTHLLTYLIQQQYEPQIWLNEAVADYFGSSRIERDKKGKLVIHPGELQTDRVLTVQQAIRNGANSLPRTGEPSKSGGAESSEKKSKGSQGRPDTSLEDLFKLTREEFDGFQYAHAWSFVYFLNNFDKGKYQKAFNRFFKGLYTVEKGLPVEIVNGGGNTGRGLKVSPENIREYLLKKLGVKDTAQLEKDWKSYIAAIPIAGPEARLKRGLYAVRGLRFEDALEDLDAAIDGGVTDPRAWWARGRAKAAAHKPDEAIKDLEKAVEMDPLNAAFRYELSRLRTGRMTLVSRGPGSNVQIEEKDEAKIDNPEAKREAGLACELDPDNERYSRWFERFQ
jgi:tetratricopeptide (TPR) repeat protein